LGGSAKQFADLFIYLAYFCFVKQRILLFDTILDGHHPDYLFNLICYYSAFPEIDLFVATGALFQEQFESRKQQEQLVWGKNITFLPIPMEKIQGIHALSIYKRSFVEWNLMLDLANQVHASHSLLMYFDYFQLGAWLGKRASIPVSGIYFRPNFLANQKGFYPRLKKWILKKSLQSGQLKNLFCLGTESLAAIQALSQEVNVEDLCDPVRLFNIDQKDHSDFQEKLQLPANKKVYLNFGHLDNRKGIESFLKGCENLPNSVLESMCLLLVGPIRPAYQQVIEAAIARVPGLQVICRFGYLPAPEVQMCFEASDVVLLLYQGHLGSSSVLVRAAMAKKLMLGSDKGQIGALIQKNHFGLAVDSSSPSAIKATIEELQGNKVFLDISSCDAFASSNSIQKFGDTIRLGIESSY
jgi:glycosyltransferase involved in cell wall biosynthesis